MISLPLEVEILRLLTQEGPLTVAELCDRSSSLARGKAVRHLRVLLEEGCVTFDGVTAGQAYRPASLFRATEEALTRLQWAQQVTWSPDHAVLLLLSRQGRSTVGDLIEGSRDDPNMEAVTRRVVSRSLKNLLEPSSGKPLIEVAAEMRRRSSRPAAKLYQISSDGQMALDEASRAAAQLIPVAGENPG